MEPKELANVTADIVLNKQLKLLARCEVRSTYYVLHGEAACVAEQN